MEGGFFEPKNSFNGLKSLTREQEIEVMNNRKEFKRSMELLLESTPNLEYASQRQFTETFDKILQEYQVLLLTLNWTYNRNMEILVRVVDPQTNARFGSLQIIGFLNSSGQFVYRVMDCKNLFRYLQEFREEYIQTCDFEVLLKNWKIFQEKYL